MGTRQRLRPRRASNPPASTVPIMKPAVPKLDSTPRHLVSMPMSFSKRRRHREHHDVAQPVDEHERQDQQRLRLREKGLVGREERRRFLHRRLSAGWSVLRMMLFGMRHDDRVDHRHQQHQRARCAEPPEPSDCPGQHHERGLPHPHRRPVGGHSRPRIKSLPLPVQGLQIEAVARDVVHGVQRATPAITDQNTREIAARRDDPHHDHSQAQ